MLLARTDWDVPKHRGITCFVLPMHQPGVTVRPLRQMNGHQSFNEVFMTGHGSQAGNDDRASRATAGRVAHHRRSPTSGGSAASEPAAHRRGGARPGEEARAEEAVVAEPHKWYPQRAGRADLVIEHARADGQGQRPGRPPGDRAGCRTLSLDGQVDRRARGGRAGGRAARRGRRAPSASSPPARSPASAPRSTRSSPAPRACWPGRSPRWAGSIAEILVSVPGDLDRRRHRRDPAHNHRRADPRPAEGTGHQPERAVPRGAQRLSCRGTAALKECHE